MILLTLFQSMHTKVQESLKQTAERLLKWARPQAHKYGYSGKSVKAAKDNFVAEFTAIADAVIENLKNLLSKAESDSKTYEGVLSVMDEAREIKKARNASSDEERAELEPILATKAEIENDIASKHAEFGEVDAQEGEFFRQNPDKNINERENFLNSKKAIILFVVLHSIVETPFIQKAFSDTHLLDNGPAWVVALFLSVIVNATYLGFGKAVADKKIRMAIAWMFVPCAIFVFVFCMRYAVLDSTQLAGLMGVSAVFILAGGLLGIKYFEHQDIFRFRWMKQKIKDDIKNLNSDLAKVELQVEEVDQRFADNAEYEYHALTVEMQQKKLNADRDIVRFNGELSSTRLDKADLLKAGLASIDDAYARGKASREDNNRPPGAPMIAILIMCVSLLGSCGTNVIKQDSVEIGVVVDHSRTVKNAHLPSADDVIERIVDIATLDEKPFSAKIVEVRISSAGHSSIRQFETVKFEYPGYISSSGDQYEVALVDFKRDLKSELQKFYKGIDTEDDTMIYSSLTQGVKWMSDDASKHLLFLSDMVEDSRFVQFDELYEVDPDFHRNQYDVIDSTFMSYHAVDLNGVHITSVYPTDNINDGLHQSASGFWTSFIEKRGGKIEFTASL